MIGYFFVRVEVERLVHHAVQVRHPVVGLDRERLGILEPGLDQRAEIRLLEVGHHRARRVVERRFGRRVHARGVVDEDTCSTSDIADRVRGFTRVEQFHARAVEPDTIQVGEVRILALLATGGRDVGHARFSSTASRPVVTNSPSVIRFFSAPVSASYR